LEGAQRELDSARMAKLVEVVSGANAQVSVELPAGFSDDAVGELVSAGVRKLSAPSAFTSMVLSAVPEDVRASVREQAGTRDVAEALALAAETLAQLDPSANERIEALSYGEALALLPRSVGSGSATRVSTFLAENAGY
jgi:hypothetical protein